VRNCELTDRKVSFSQEHVNETDQFRSDQFPPAAKLADLDVPIIMISGNHDSAHRLGLGSGLFARAGIHLRTDPATCNVPVLLEDADGPVAVYGI
jgi:DNA repair exonuclease SbcCD nuclease subunit